MVLSFIILWKLFPFSQVMGSICSDNLVEQKFVNLCVKFKCYNQKIDRTEILYRKQFRNFHTNIVKNS